MIETILLFLIFVFYASAFYVTVRSSVISEGQSVFVTHSLRLARLCAIALIVVLLYRQGWGVELIDRVAVLMK